MTTIAPKARKVGGTQRIIIYALKTGNDSLTGRNAKVAYQSLTTSLKDIHARLYVFLRNRALSWKNLRVLVSCSTPQLLKITRALLGHITTDLESIQEGSSLLPSKCILFLDDVPCNLVSKMHIAIQIGFPPSDEHRKSSSHLFAPLFVLTLASSLVSYCVADFYPGWRDISTCTFQRRNSRSLQKHARLSSSQAYHIPKRPGGCVCSYCNQQSGTRHSPTNEVGLLPLFTSPVCQEISAQSRTCHPRASPILIRNTQVQ